MTSVAPEQHEKTIGETRLVSVDFGDSAAGEENRTGKLSSGELLTGTVTVITQSKSPDTATDLTDETTTLGNTALETTATNITALEIGLRRDISYAAVEATVIGASLFQFLVKDIL